MKLPFYHRKRLGQDQIVRRFDPLEDALITAMRIEGAGTTEISRALADCGRFRTPATINMRLKTLAEITEREEIETARREFRAVCAVPFSLTNPPE